MKLPYNRKVACKINNSKIKYKATYSDSLLYLKWNALYNFFFGMKFFKKKVTKERLELKTSYLIRQVLINWSRKTYCNVQKEDWGCCCCCCLLKTALESVLQKNSFHTRKKFRFSMTTRVRSRLAYPLFLIFRDRIRRGAKSIRRSKRVAARKKKHKPK